MKKTIIFTALIVAGLPSFAQIQRKIVKQNHSDSVAAVPIQQKNEPRKKLFRELDLSKEQKGKLKEINQSMKISRESIETDTSLSADQKQNKLRAIKKDHFVKTQAILTTEQKIKLRALRATNKTTE